MDGKMRHGKVMQDENGEWHVVAVGCEVPVKGVQDEADARPGVVRDIVINSSMQQMYEQMREHLCEHYGFESYYDWEVLPIKAQLALIDAMYPEEKGND